MQETGFCDMSSVPTAETWRLQEEAEAGRGTEQRSDCKSRQQIYDLTVKILRSEAFVHFFIVQAAVEKYDEVLHNLAFAQELHKTLDGLTQNVSDSLTCLHHSDFYFFLLWDIRDVD